MNNTNVIRAEYMDIYSIKRRHNGHWFDADSMRFFSSRLPQGGWKLENKVYFITSEQFKGMYEPDGKRLYTLRVMDYQTGSVNTVGDFNKLSKSEAQTALNNILKGSN
jgi:hypothetical protein